MIACEAVISQGCPYLITIVYTRIIEQGSLPYGFLLFPSLWHTWCHGSLVISRNLNKEEILVFL